MPLFQRSNPHASKVRQLAGMTVAQRLDADPRAERAAVDGLAFYYVRDFLTPDQCAGLIRMIEADRHPSTVLSDRNNDGFRTSESCDMDRWSPAVQPIDEAIAALLGIEPLQGETMQGQRYAPGQQFRAHHDFFHATQGYWKRMKTSGGQRTWTAMVYLNDVPEGGETWFPKAGIRVAPKQGLLLTWNNMAADGSPNMLTIHEGMPVVEGVKYIVTKWFREGRWIEG